MEPFEEKLHEEAQKMAHVIFSNWKFGMEEGHKLLPDLKNREQLVVQWDIFAQALIGATVNCLATYGSYTEEFEQLVTEQVKHCFGEIRENQGKVKIVDINAARPVKLTDV